MKNRKKGTDYKGRRIKKDRYRYIKMKNRKKDTEYKERKRKKDT